MSDLATETLAFTNRFFADLQEAGIRYCILRNADEVEQGDAHDIDMTVDDTRQAEAETIMFRAAANAGWLPQMQMGSMKQPFTIKCYNFYKVLPATGELVLVHIDFFPSYAWRSYELLDNAALLSNIDTNHRYHRLDTATEAVTKLFVRLLYNGRVKEKYKASVQLVYQQQQAEVTGIMQRFLSEPLARSIAEDAANGNWESIDARRKEIAADVTRHARRRKGLYTTYLLRKALHRAAPIVAIQGTDGSGKTTIIEQLQHVLGNTFSDNTFTCYHWRPGFLFPETKRNADGSVVDASQPHAQKPRGFFGSLLRLGAFAADYILGYWCKAYVQAAQGHLVIFDRYYYDFYLDKQRYRMTMPNAVLRLVQCFIPEPDITFVLVGDAATIYARKKEIPQEEVQAQIDRLQAIKHRFANPVTIDVNQPIPAVVNAVGTAIMEHLNRRHG